MRFVYNCLACVTLWLPLSAQSSLYTKYDNVWALALGIENNNPNFGGLLMDFSSVPPNFIVTTQEHDMLYAGVSICDSMGQLLCYSNGMHIFDVTHAVMENGDSLCVNEVNYITATYPQSVLMLPMPGDNRRIAVIHQEKTFEQGDANDPYQAREAYFTVIDMSVNDGLGKVIDKRDIIIADTLASGKITACRHANGRDWWIILPERNTDRYYRYLLTPNGINEYPAQHIGTPMANGVGSACFSPDGNKYIKTDALLVSEPGIVQIFDFDRCTGLLSNPVFLPDLGDNEAEQLFTLWAVVSPNSRYLYIMAVSEVWQFDLWASDILSTKQVVAVYDGTMSPFWTNFFFAANAPDGKIYLWSSNGNNKMHVMQHPNEQGLACDIVQNAISLPTYQSTYVNFPNFRLGPIDGSACDTLGIDNIISATTAPPPATEIAVSVYPNPAHDYLVVNLPQVSNAIVTLINSSGVQVLQYPLAKLSTVIDVRDLPAGVYVYTIEQAGSVLQSGKVLKY